MSDCVHTMPMESDMIVKSKNSAVVCRIQFVNKNNPLAKVAFAAH